MSQSWFNADGLLVKFNGAAGTATTNGQYTDAMYGRSVIEMRVDLTKLTTTPGGVILDDNITLPKSAWVERIDTIVEVAGSTASSPTFDFGLIRFDRTTELDYNGLLAAVVATDLDTINERHTYEQVTSGGMGALGGTATANGGYFTANANTATFSTGVVRVLVYFRENANVLGGADA